MYRFARAESEFLNQLKAEVLGLLGEEQSVVGASLARVPLGGLPFTPILESLLDALGIKGTFASFEPLDKSCHICLGSSVPTVAQIRGVKTASLSLSLSPLPGWKSSRQDF